MIALWLASTALAGCDDVASGGLATGPVVAGLVDGDLGRARRVCPRDEVGATGGIALTVDTPNFYGHIVGGLTVDGSTRIGDRGELFGAIETVRYDTVISALSATYLGLGHTVVGGSYMIAEPGDRPGFAVNAKAVLPTAVGLYANSFPIGLDLGVAGHIAQGPWAAHWQLSTLTSWGLGAGPLQPRVGVAPTVGGEWRPGKAFGAVLDLTTGFGYTAAVDHVAVAPGVRFSDGRRWGLQLGATLPLLGRERQLATADLRTTVRLGPIPEE